MPAEGRLSLTVILWLSHRPQTVQKTDEDTVLKYNLKHEKICLKRKHSAGLQPCCQWRQSERQSINAPAGYAAASASSLFCQKYSFSKVREIFIFKLVFLDQRAPGKRAIALPPGA